MVFLLVVHSKCRFWTLCLLHFEKLGYSPDFFTLLSYLNVFPMNSDATELINKLNFLEDEDQDTAPAMTTNPFDEPDGDLQSYPLNPFGYPEEEGG